MSLTRRIMEELDPGRAEQRRQFRVKFPDDILTDSLAGQLWFGAECLAAGSSILHKERESEAMRPLAKAVVKSLDKVRVGRERGIYPRIKENVCCGPTLDDSAGDFSPAFV